MSDSAKAGDVKAAQLILDRLYPQPKDRRIKIRMPEIRDLTDVPAAAAYIITAAADGELSPTEAGEMLKLLDSYRAAIVSDDLEERLAAIEEKFAGEQ